MQTFKPRDNEQNDMLPEYNFDYSKARPNRFVGRFDEKDSLVVVLDPDIAEVFTTPDAVNAVLRALISTMPGVVKSRVIGESPARI